MLSRKDLCEFLVKAKKATYAAGDSTQEVREDDGSKTLVFKEGDWLYNDNYFGGEPYGGREVVFFNGAPVYLMTYYGMVDESIIDVGEIYKFLQEALALIPSEKPFRGPKEYSRGDLLYVNNFSGEVDYFSGEEIIRRDGEEIYRAKFMGGFVDQRK